jgi:hypothetical protein
MSTTLHSVVFEMQRLTGDIMERLDTIAGVVGPEHLRVRVARAHILGLADQLRELGGKPHELGGNPEPDIDSSQR